MIMRRGTHIGLLRHDAVRADRDLADAIQRRAVANPAVIPDYHVPRKGDTNTRPNQDPCPDLRAEQAQSEPPPAVEDLWRGPDEDRLEQPPQLDKPGRTTARPLREAKARQILIAVIFQSR